MEDLKDKTKGEKWWILMTRIGGFVIMFLPFIPNALYYIGINEDKIKIEASELFFCIIGFVLVWGSGRFGSWANTMGKSIVDKIKK